MTKGSDENDNNKKNHRPSITIPRQPWIGGPGSRLPFVVESFLGWGLAISCLSVACYHYVRQMASSSSSTLALLLPSSSSSSTTRPQDQKTTTSNTTKRRRISNSPFLPLTTHSRKEILSKSTLERYQQLHLYLCKLDPSKTNIEDWSQKTDDLVQLIRSNLLLRRLVSLFMVKQHQDPLLLLTKKKNDDNDFYSPTIQVLTEIWPQLVQLPPSPTMDTKEYDHDISIIIPAYRESGQLLFTKLQEAHDLITIKEFKSCKMEVVVVHAHCTEMEALQQQQGDVNSTMPHFQNKITCTPDVGGGRGPCLNRGAQVAKGRILTFLHADTRLSLGWNEAILQAFANNNNNNNSDNDNATTTRIVNSCAFSFAIDTSSIIPKEKGDDNNHNHNNNNNNHYFPPGIRAVETTANWRSHWFHLPYGDQCLSIPRHVFDYLGGYPHQCLMEDYELVRLLRQRVALLGQEQLKILPMPAKCHVRRWQKLGVLYVTMTNSKLVNLYSRQTMTAEELFSIYYGMDPEGKDDPIPWEVELEECLLKK